MSGRDTPKDPTQLMANYWAACLARGDKPRRLYGVVALPGALQPAGYVIGWSVGRDYAEMVQARQQDPDKWEIQDFFPPEPKTPV